MTNSIPVILFAYNRPEHLQRTVNSLRSNEIPLLYAFSDGPRTPKEVESVCQVREVLRSIDWCDLVLCEREENLGLGKSILRGVNQVFGRHDAVIVFEDDLICVPGTYQYLCAALNHYRDDSRVMSVTGWTHPRATPSTVREDPYFDGRSESWVWGTWSRVWAGMDQDAYTLMRQCEMSGMDIYRYGADLPRMARGELKRNIWAVRIAFLHIRHKGLCLRPPHSMVEHIGFGPKGTNVRHDNGWSNPPLLPCPTIPTRWPEPVENPECSVLWQKALGARPGPFAYQLDILRRLVINRLTR